MALDAIIVSDAGTRTYSTTNPLKLMIEGRTADIQVVKNYLENNGRIVPPIQGDGLMSWTSAPKLNGIYLFNFLSRHGFKVDLINSYFNEKSRFLELLKESPKAIILSTTFITDKKALKELVADIRDVAPGITIIAGGAFVYLSYKIFIRANQPSYAIDSIRDDYLFQTPENEPNINVYIISLRGEKILCDVLSKTKDNEGSHGVPNTAIFDGKRYHMSGRVDDLSDFEDFPIDWEAIPKRFFQSGVISLQASTGCPYKCAFCNFIKDNRLSYVKPLDFLISELKCVSSKGIKYIWFVDDNFRLGKNDLEEVCRRFLDASIDIRWMTFIRASSLKDIDTNLLRKAGCIEVQLGLESADPQLLKNMNKNVDLTVYDTVLNKLLSAGINCSCYFIFGFPGETAKSAKRTREFLKKYQNNTFEGTLQWSLFPFVLAPLSPIYEEEIRNQFELVGYMNNWRHSTMTSDTVLEEIMTTFLELDDSGPIYRGDNLEILRSLEPYKQKHFQAVRHKLSKTALSGTLEKETILKSFSNFSTLK